MNVDSYLLTTSGESAVHSLRGGGNTPPQVGARASAILALAPRVAPGLMRERFVLLLPWRRPPLALRWAIFLGEQFAHIRDHKKSPHSQG